MKKIVYFLALALLSINAFADNLKLNNSHHDYQILSDEASYLELNFNVNNLTTDDITNEKGTFTRLSFNSGYKTGNVGTPALPTFNNLIEMPYGSNSTVQVVSYDVKEYSLAALGIKHDLAPVQPSYEKNIDPADIKFEFNKAAYAVNAYSEKKLASLTKNGTMRGVDLATLVITPFNYNPVQKKIKIYSNIKVRVNYNANLTKAQEIKQTHYSPFFEGAYPGVINYKKITARDNETNQTPTYLIVANEGLENSDKLDEFIAWKTQKGFNVIPHFVASTASVNEIDSWVEEQYETLEPKPSFLLLIGDVNGVFVVNAERPEGNPKISDLAYGVIGPVEPSNHLPSILVGRFSVRNENELEAQVDKTIWYEKEMFTDPEGDPSYLENCMGTAGADSEGYTASHGNPHIYYMMDHYFNNSSYHYPLYNSIPTINGIPFYDGGIGQQATIIDKINDGVAFYNYTAHGGEEEFVDPKIRIFDIELMDNKGKYGLIIGNCCVTGTFSRDECFGEAWLNAADKGAIGFIGASMNTSWDEDLAMGVGEPASGNTTPAYSPEKPGTIDAMMMMTNSTQAGVKNVGLMAVDAMNSDRTMDYWKAYNLLGDPSLMPYMGIPEEMVVSHIPVISLGATELQVQAPAGALVSLSDSDGRLYNSVIADENGAATIKIEEGIISQNDVLLVITAPFKVPHIEQIPVAAGGLPLVITDYNITNNKYGEIADIDIQVENFDHGSSSDIILTATTTNEYATIIDGSESYEDMEANTTQMIEDAITVKLANDVPDQENIKIKLDIAYNTKGSYEKTITLVANAPVLECVFASDEIIESGGTEIFTYTLTNTGHAELNNVNISLSETNNNLTILDPEISIEAIAAGASTELSFTADIAAGLTPGTTSNMQFEVTADKGFTYTYKHAVLIEDPVIFSEEFEVFPFNGWTNSQWTQTAYGFNGKAASVPYNHSGEAILESPEFSFSGAAQISFQWENRDYYDNTRKSITPDSTFFEITHNGGTSWKQLALLAKTSPDAAYNKEIINISDYSDYNLKVRWRDINDGSFDAYGTGVDALLIEYLPNDIETNKLTIPTSATLYQNYPNPFNPSTTINFYNKQTGYIKLSIFNIKGELVENLVNKRMEKGFHNVMFNAANLNSGVYFYSLQTANTKLVKKMMLVK